MTALMASVPVLTDHLHFTISPAIRGNCNPMAFAVLEIFTSTLEFLTKMGAKGDFNSWFNVKKEESPGEPERIRGLCTAVEGWQGRWLA
ncbi:uncharacterized protein ACO6RY_05483 [Pungitius sinensis]